MAGRHSARTGHEATDAKPTFGELFGDRLNVLKAEGYIDSRAVPTDGKRLHVPVDPEYALTRPTTSHDGNVRVRLAGIVTTQSGSVLSVGQARVRNPLEGTSRSLFFVSEPPKPGQERAGLIGSFTDGFPTNATEERVGAHDKTERLWNLEFSVGRDGAFAVREVSAEDDSQEARVFIAADPWLADHGGALPNEFWAPDPSELARATRDQASSLGETAIIAVVKEDLDPTVVIPLDELDKTVVLHRLPQ
jgi:hypothetical protein